MRALHCPGVCVRLLGCPLSLAGGVGVSGVSCECGCESHTEIGREKQEASGAERGEEGARIAVSHMAAIRVDENLERQPRALPEHTPNIADEVGCTLGVCDSARARATPVLHQHRDIDLVGDGRGQPCPTRRRKMLRPAEPARVTSIHVVTSNRPTGGRAQTAELDCLTHGRE